MSDLDLVLDTLVSDSMLATGYDPKIMAARGDIARPVAGGKSHRPRWSDQEDQFLRDHISYLPFDEISGLMGRSLNALHVRIIRAGIPTMSRQPGWMTALQVAKLLSIDGHKVTGWIDRGMLPGRRLPSERNIQVVRFEDLKRWLVRPENWPYFKVNRIKSESLRSLVMKAQARWGDEWWTTRQMADYHNCNICLIKQNIFRGKLPAIQRKNIGGRGRATWANWFVRKSVVMAWKVPKLTDPRKHYWTDRSDAFLMSARASGLTYYEIGRLMKWPQERVAYRSMKLKKEAGSANHQD